ncbi:hypothetical protein J5X84_20330 [Streptosporangiaceae bacterium NEAU-GS5]|nr:hypothetical protein [Streptosporangiaceae bacterium NEAU-GS5]
MNDDELEDALRRAAAIMDPVPSHLLQSATEAYVLRTLDAELAALTFDSVTEPSPVRAGEGARLLTFEAGGTTIEVELTFAGDVGALVGQIMPPQAAEVEVEGGAEGWGERLVLYADPLGRFAWDRLRRGPVSLRVRLGDGVVATEWITA